MSSSDKNAFVKLILGIPYNFSTYEDIYNVAGGLNQKYAAARKEIDKIIKKIEQERDARLKALDAQQSAADFNIQLQKEQLTYQQQNNILLPLI